MGCSRELVREVWRTDSASRSVFVSAFSAGDVTRNANISVFVVSGLALRASRITVATIAFLPEVLALREALSPTTLTVRTVGDNAGATRVVTIECWIEFIIWKEVDPVDLKAIGIGCNFETRAFLLVVLRVDHSD